MVSWDISNPHQKAAYRASVAFFWLSPGLGPSKCVAAPETAFSGVLAGTLVVEAKNTVSSPAPVLGHSPAVDLAGFGIGEGVANAVFDLPAIALAAHEPLQLTLSGELVHGLALLACGPFGQFRQLRDFFRDAILGIAPAGIPAGGEEEEGGEHGQTNPHLCPVPGYPGGLGQLLGDSLAGGLGFSRRLFQGPDRQAHGLKLGFHLRDVFAHGGHVVLVDGHHVADVLEDFFNVLVHVYAPAGHHLMNFSLSAGWHHHFLCSPSHLAPRALAASFSSIGTLR